MTLPVCVKVEKIMKNNYCFNCLGRYLVNNCKAHFSCSLHKQERKNQASSFFFTLSKNYESLHNVSISNASGQEVLSTTARVNESILSPNVPMFHSQNNNSVLPTWVINKTKIVLLSIVNSLLRDDRGNNYRVCG